MIRTLVIAAGLATLFIAPCANAATSIDCALDKLSPQERDRWGKFMVAQLNGEKPAEPNMDEGYSAIRDCAMSLNWSEPAIRSVINYIMTKTAMPVQAERLGKLGYDVAKITAAYDSLSADHRRELSLAEGPQATVKLLIAAMTKMQVFAGRKNPDPNMAFRYVALLAQRDAAILAFTAA